MQGIGTSSVDLSTITTFLFDLDGVLWRGGTAIEGAAEAVKQLREAGRKCLFCTNNSSRTTAHFVEKLKDIGIEAEEEDILTSSWVTAHYLSGHFTGPFLTYVIGEDGIRSALQKIGAHVVPDSDLDGIQHVDCVVVGIDRQFDYQKLANAQKLIMNGALFIATNRDGSFPLEDGVAPGGGSVVAAVEVASGTPPVTVGKPRPVMIDLAMQKLNVKQGEVAMVGDRLDTDIVCARRAGVTAVCITTGVTSLEAAQRARGELRPHYVFENLDAMCQQALTASPAVTTPLEEAPVAEPAPEAAPESIEEPAAAESTFSLSETASEEAPATLAEETPVEEAAEEEDTSWTENIDEIFQEAQKGEDEADTIDSAESALDLDKALSVSENKAPEPPPSQKPAEDGNKEKDAFDWKLD